MSSLLARFALSCATCIAASAATSAAASAAANLPVLQSVRMVGDVRPGQDDPLQNPSRMWLFRDDQAFVPASLNRQPQDLVLAAEDKSLTRWRQDRVAPTECGGAARRYAAGRITTPEHDTLVCATNHRVDLFDPPLHLDLPDAYQASPRPVGLAVGEVDKRLQPNGLAHADIVVAYQMLDRRIRVLVLDHQLQPLAHWDTPEPVSGDVDVALGDFAADGKLAVALATSERTDQARKGSAPAATTNGWTLRVLRYSAQPAEAASLELASSFSATTPRPAESLVIQTGDFSGYGADGIALAYHLGGVASPAHVTLFRTDDKLKLEAGGTGDFGEVAAGTYLDLAAGLFRVKPPTYSLQRRQLSLVYAESAQRTAALILDVTDFNHFAAGPTLRIDAPVATVQIGPGVAAGNFIGLREVDSLRHQLGIVIPIDDGNYRSHPRFIAAEVDEGFGLKIAAQVDLKDRSSTGMVWTQKPLAFDPAGASYYLGAPVHIVVPKVLSTRYTIEEPPKHLTCFEEDGSCTPGNVSAYSDFYVQLSQGQEKILETSSRDTTSWDIGGSVAGSAVQTVSGGFPGIASAEVTTSERVAVGYDYSQITEDTNSTYKETRITSSDSTNSDDQLIYTVQLLDIWRYPVYGLKTKDAAQRGFYEIVLPGNAYEAHAAGGTQDWYQPLHQNKNILTYPQIGATDFPPDLGEFTPSGESKPVRDWINDKTVYHWDGNARMVEINWNERAGTNSSKTYRQTLRESTDIGVAFSGSVDVELVSARTQYSVDFNFQNQNSWEQNSVANRVIGSSKGISLNKPYTGGSALQAYAFQTAVYVSEQGAFKVAQAVNALGAPSGQAWWREHYGVRANPSVNLPNRFSYIDYQWTLTPGEQRYQLRGFYLRNAVPDPVTGKNDLFACAISDGDRLLIGARVYNTSLKNEPVRFETVVEAEEVDPASGLGLGTRERIGSESALLGPLETRELSIPWDTTGWCRNVPGGKIYRFWTTADPTKLPAQRHAAQVGVRDIPDAADNTGFWPWSGGVTVYCRPSGALVKTAAPAAGLAALALANDSAATSRAGHPIELALKLDSTEVDRATRFVVLIDKDGSGDRVIAGRTLMGVPAGGETLRIPWRPARAGQHTVSALLFEPDSRLDGHRVLSHVFEIAEPKAGPPGSR